MVHTCRSNETIDKLVISKLSRTIERRRSSLCPCLTKEETQRAAIQDYIRPTC